MGGCAGDAAVQVVTPRLLRLGTTRSSDLDGIPELKPDAWVSLGPSILRTLARGQSRTPLPPPAWARSQALPYLWRPGAPSAVPGERLQRRLGGSQSVSARDLKPPETPP